MRDEKGRFIKGHPLGVRFEKGKNPWNKGKTYKNPKQALAMKGRIPWNKGLDNGKVTLSKTDKNAYRNLHKKITKLFGKPDTCENCGKSGLQGKAIHWANIDGRYTMNRQDWKRLCAQCHIAMHSSNYLFNVPQNALTS